MPDVEATSMTLHDAMVEVLRRHGGGWMDRDAVADEIAADALFVRPSDGMPAPSDQLRLRARSSRYSHLFACSDTACTKIRLRSLPERELGSKPPGAAGAEPEPSAARAARVRRANTAAKYRPVSIDLLLIAEAPPQALDRYFYFDDVAKHDALYRYVVRSVLGDESSRVDKAKCLYGLQQRGVYLIDVSPDPMSSVPLCEHVPDLVSRACELKPKNVILIKATVYDVAYAALAKAQLPVIDERVPFPGSGQQRRFETSMNAALSRLRA